MKLQRVNVTLAVFAGVAGLVVAVSGGVRAGERSANRAFYTAPPTVTHELDNLGNEDCQICHEDVLDLGDRVSIPTPHPQFSNCLQCHVGTGPPAFLDQVEIESGWIGLEDPVKIERRNEVAPPVLSHRLFLRDKCLSCHHPEHPRVNMRTSHPDRSNCLQCHVVIEERQF